MMGYVNVEGDALYIHMKLADLLTKQKSDFYKRSLKASKNFMRKDKEKKEIKF